MFVIESRCVRWVQRQSWLDRHHPLHNPASALVWFSSFSPPKKWTFLNRGLTIQQLYANHTKSWSSEIFCSEYTCTCTKSIWRRLNHAQRWQTLKSFWGQHKDFWMCSQYYPGPDSEDMLCQTMPFPEKSRRIGESVLSFRIDGLFFPSTNLTSHLLNNS